MTERSEVLDSQGPQIIVGIDGSENSERALRWAIAEAIRWEADIEAVTVWQFPALGIELPSTGRALHHNALAAAQKVIDRAVADLADGEREMPSIHLTAYLSDPAERLIALSSGADLIVVGTRGTGGFRSLLLGSVSRKVVSHARCAVVVVPPADSDEKYGVGERFGAEHPDLAQAVEGVSQHLSAMGI